MRDLATQAPNVGRVLPLLGATTLAGQRLRRSEVVLDAVATVGWRAAGASLAGLRHLSEGTCRQDSFGIFVTAPDRLWVVVADGLGSRPVSQLGADLFVEAVGQLIEGGDEYVRRGPTDLLLAASARTEQVAETTYGLTAAEIAFVGLVASIGPEPTGVARLGDVSVFAHDGKEFTELFDATDTFINVIDVSLPATDVAKSVEMRSLPPGPLVFASDGLAQDIRGSGAVRAWLAECWRTPLTAFAMGDSLRYRRQGSHDDRTGVVVWPSA